MQLKLFVLFSYLLSNSKNEAADSNEKVVTKYIYHTYNYGNVLTFERNKFNEKVSELGVIFYQ